MARAALHVSVEQLAHDAHVAPSTVRRFEKTRGLPTASVRTMIRLERALTARGAIFVDHPQIDGSVIRTVAFRDPLPSQQSGAVNGQLSLI